MLGAREHQLRRSRLHWHQRTRIGYIHLDSPITRSPRDQFSQAPPEPIARSNHFLLFEQQDRLRECLVINGEASRAIEVAEIHAAKPTQGLPGTAPAAGNGRPQQPHSGSRFSRNLQTNFAARASFRIKLGAKPHNAARRYSNSRERGMGPSSPAGALQSQEALTVVRSLSFPGS
jgi:hypothetical protein